MFLSRILVIFTNPIDLAGAADSIAQARSAAARPGMLRFALPSLLMEGLGSDDALLFYNEDAGLSCLSSLVTDETHFLLLCGPHGFSPKWDVAFSRMFRRLSRGRTLLTGHISPGQRQPAPAESAPAETRTPQENSLQTLRRTLPEVQKALSESPAPPPAAPQAYLPALAPREYGAEFTRGMPLVCTDTPVSTLAVDPALVFGPTDFLFEEGLAADNLSLTAFLSAYSPYAIPAAAVWPLRQLPPRLLRLPRSTPGTTMARFAGLAGLAGSQPRTSAKASMGLFGSCESYSQQIPLRLRLLQRMKAAKMNLFDTHMALLVSAFIDLPGVSRPQDWYTIRFSFLREITALPLLVYTGGSQERLLRAALPNTQSYPDTSLLPMTLLEKGMTPAQHFARSKPLLLGRASRRQTEHSHIAWVDLDILHHPLPSAAVPSFEPFMDEFIHLAVVDGVPDPSFFILPSRFAHTLGREAASITLLDADLGYGLDETLLWQQLIERHPDWFTLHPMPQRRMLFLSAFDRRLFTPETQQLLQDLPAPYPERKPPKRTLKGVFFRA